MPATLALSETSWSLRVEPKVRICLLFKYAVGWRKNLNCIPSLRAAVYAAAIQDISDGLL